MRVSLVVLGSRGDVQPFIALGTTLKSRGHTVTLATHTDYQPLVEEGDLDFLPLPGSPQDFLTHPALVEALQQGASIFRATRKVPRDTPEHLQNLAARVAEVTAGADLIVNTTLSRISFDDDGSAPWASLTWWPLNATSRWPSMMLPRLPLGPVYNRLTYRLSGLMEWYVVQDYRKRSNLPPLKFGDPFANLGREVPVLCASTRTLFTEPSDWPGLAHITGYWFWDRDWTPTPALADFVNDGSPPVTLTFGSIWPVHPADETLEKVLSVVRRHKRRLVMVGGPKDTPDDVFQIDDVHYPWLFPRSAAVIHHGGCNTTAEAFRSGTPQVIVPTFADSPFWAAKACSLGVAAKPIPYPKFTAERLDESLTTALQDESMRQAADRVSQAVRAERGVENASQILEEWAERWHNERKRAHAAT